MKFCLKNLNGKYNIFLYIILYINMNIISTRLIVENCLVNQTGKYNLHAEFFKKYNTNIGEYYIGYSSRKLFDKNRIIGYDCLEDAFKLCNFEDLYIIFSSNVIKNSEFDHLKDEYDNFLKTKCNKILLMSSGCQTTKESGVVLNENIINLLNKFDIIVTRGDFTTKILYENNIRTPKIYTLGCHTLFSSIINNNNTLPKLNILNYSDIKKLLVAPTCDLSLSSYTNQWSDCMDTYNILKYNFRNNSEINFKKTILITSEKMLYSMYLNKFNDLNYNNLFKNVGNIDDYLDKFKKIDYTKFDDYKRNKEHNELFESVIDQNNNIILPSTFTEWDNILKSNDFIISTRVHTSLKSISLNLPVITLAHDSRVLELCKKMCIPYIENLDSLENCVLSYNKQVEKFNDNIKKYYHDYLNFFIENKIPIKNLNNM
tara:strand:+ start:4834 stop:6123 length:1290 start_codon:yes stop_codon:yes gene_type:complete